ncbi:MAG: hypothetical protein H8E40_04435 [Chloroflexi bacterium]|nr:hypothetical protein [Chloroflexota bacterium]
MTIRLSPQRVTKIMRLYFSGQPQTQIARKVRVDQSTVSLYASRFTEHAQEAGLLTAGKEFGVYNEIEALRSLSVELSKSSLTAEEAKEGCKIIKTFLKLGIRPEQHLTLVKVCKEAGDPGFVHAAAKLSILESQTNMGYNDIVWKLKDMVSRLASVEAKLEKTQTRLKSVDAALAEKGRDLANLENHFKLFQQEVAQKESELEAQLAERTKETHLATERIDKLEPLAKTLQKLGVSDDTLETYIRKHQELDEVGIGWDNFVDIVKGFKDVN